MLGRGQEFSFLQKRLWHVIGHRGIRLRCLHRHYQSHFVFLGGIPYNLHILNSCDVTGHQGRCWENDRNSVYGAGPLWSLCYICCTRLGEVRYHWEQSDRLWQVRPQLCYREEWNNTLLTKAVELKTVVSQLSGCATRAWNISSSKFWANPKPILQW